MSDQFYRGQEFALGDQVTAQKLMDLVNKATLQTGAVSSQPAITTKTVAADDQIIALDASASLLVKVKAEDILQSNIPVEAESVKTNTINGVTGADTVITPAAGQKVSLVGNMSVSGTFTPTSINPSTESFGFTGTKAFTIPSGNTAARPTSPVLGDMRWNTETSRSEIWDGTTWKELGTPPFDASGGDIVLAPEATTTAAIFSSDGSIVTITNASGHSVNEGQIVEVKSSTAGYTKFEGVAYDVTTYTFKISLKPLSLAVVSNIACTYRKSGRHKIHIFKNSGTFTVTSQSPSTIAEIVLIGGGGGSIQASGGGQSITGSSGGIAHIANYEILPNNTYSIIVGNGGASVLGNSSGETAGTGGNTSAFGFIAYGAEGASNVGTNYSGSTGGNNIGKSGSGRYLWPSPYQGKGYGWRSSYDIPPADYLTYYNFENYHLTITNVLIPVCSAGNYVTSTPSPKYGDGGSTKSTTPRAAYNAGSGVVIIKYPYWVNL